MRALNLKLLRDLGTMKGQTVAVALVMACGLIMMIMARSLILSLELARDSYYKDHRFAEVFCSLKRAPNSLRSRLAEIPGVAAVDTRVQGAGILDIPGMKETADATLVSLPDDRPQNLNLLYLRKGRYPQVGSRKEVVVAEAFAAAHGFEPGDTIEATIYGARERLRIVGIGLSPEFVVELPPGTIVPDNRRFGVFWMNERELATALGMDGAFNNVILDAAPGANRPLIIAELDRLLKPYGGLMAYDRSDQPSAKMLDDRIMVLRGFSIAFPAIFLSIAAFMTSAALARLVRLQRGQIAQLKALGYSSREVGWHYLKFALAIVAMATTVGTLGGLLLGRSVVILYREFFHFPHLDFHPHWTAISLGLLASITAMVLGVMGAVRQAVLLPPADAMRPEPPADFKPSVLERMGLQQWVVPALRMALRNLERKPWHAFFTTVGLALATAIPIVPGVMRDSINYMMDFQWSYAQQQDATLGLIEPSSSSALNDLRHLPGVLSAEPFRSVPARIQFGHRDRRTSITGLPRDNHLNRLLNEQGEPVGLPPSGLLLSKKLADILGVKAGDRVRLEVQEGRRPLIEASVAGTITDFSGIGAYMEIKALHRLLRESDTISGAHLALDEAQQEEFLHEVKRSPRIGSVGMTSAVRDSFDETIGQMMSLVQVIYFSFAVIVSFGVVYNGARIALSERTRDLATLRVIGFTQAEVVTMLIGELAVLTFLALGPGLWIGRQLAMVLTEASSTESVRMPFVLTWQTYTTAILIVLVSSALSFTAVSQRIRKLDLIGVLKAGE